MSRVVELVKALHRDRSVAAKARERGEDVHVLRQHLAGQPMAAYQSSRLARVVAERGTGDTPVRDLSGNITQAPVGEQATQGSPDSATSAKLRQRTIRQNGGYR